MDILYKHQLIPLQEYVPEDLEGVLKSSLVISEQSTKKSHVYTLVFFLCVCVAIA